MTPKIRNPIGVFFLGMFTAGIYYAYWYYSINSEAAMVVGDRDANPGLSLAAITVGWLLIVPPFVSHWRTAQRVGRATDRPAGTASNVVFSILLLPFVSILYTFWVQGKMNGYAREQQMPASATVTV